MNRVDHQAEALYWLEEAESEIDVFSEPLVKLMLAQVHATLAALPDSISGALDARAKIAARRRGEVG